MDTLKTVTAPPLNSGYRNDLEQLYYTINQPTTAIMSDNGWAKPIFDGVTVKLESAESLVGLVPDVKGFCARDAMFMLEKNGLKVNIKGRGFVKQQSVQAGSKAIPGSLIVLDLEVQPKQL